MTAIHQENDTPLYAAIKNNALYTGILIFSSISIVIGVLWDISWHMSIGRDTLLSPPHIAIYLGGVLAGTISFIKIIQTSFFSDKEDLKTSISFWGLRAPLGAMYCLWGAGAMLTSAPFDDWWHNAYGLDVKILSPPHVVLALGIFSIQLGSRFSILAMQNRFANETVWSKWYVFSSALFVIICSIFVVEFTHRSRMHHPLFYQVACALFPLVLLSGKEAAKIKWPATTIAALYMILFMITLWVFPLFEAEPKLSPVKHPVDHFVPLSFPLLLILPAFFIDLLDKKIIFTARWKKALASALIFLSVIFISHYLFANFLISPAARNWFFAAHEWAFYIDPNAPTRYGFVNFEGSIFTFIKGMGIALVFSFLSSWTGLKWGDWMGRIQR